MGRASSGRPSQELQAGPSNANVPQVGQMKSIIGLPLEEQSADLLQR